MKMGRVEGAPPRRLFEEASRDDLDPSSSAAWAIELLRSAPPYQPTPGRKGRVRLALGQRGPRRVPLLLRPAIVVGLLLGCGAIASAALGGWPRWLVHAYERVVGPEPAPAASAGGEPSAPPQRTTSRPRAVETAPAADQPGADALAAPGPSPEATAARAPRRSRRSTGSVRGEPAVLEAMRALRVDHDPARARALLAGYLQRHANGALAEEALALSIEAALAQRDPDAAALGTRYLERYPRGAFQTLARQAAAAARQGPDRK